MTMTIIMNNMNGTTQAPRGSGTFQGEVGKVYTTFKDLSLQQLGEGVYHSWEARSPKGAGISLPAGEPWTYLGRQTAAKGLPNRVKGRLNDGSIVFFNDNHVKEDSKYVQARLENAAKRGILMQGAPRVGISQQANPAEELAAAEAELARMTADVEQKKLLARQRAEAEEAERIKRARELIEAKGGKVILEVTSLGPVEE